MNHATVLLKGTAADLERSFTADPVGFVLDLDVDDTNISRLYGHMLDNRSKVLAEAMLAYIQNHPERCALRMINLIAVTTFAWRRAERSEFLGEYPGQLEGMLQEEHKRIGGGFSNADVVRLFYRELLRLAPESRKILSENFLSFDPLDPRSITMLGNHGDDEAMLAILGYLGHSPDQVKARLEAVLDAQILMRSQTEKRSDHVEVDYEILWWLHGSEQFDLNTLRKATQFLPKERKGNLSALNRVMKAVKADTQVDVLRGVLDNLGWVVNPTPSSSLSAELVRVTVDNLCEKAERQKTLNIMLQRRLFELEDLSPLLSERHIASRVVLEGHFDRKQLMTVVAPVYRANFDFACADAWRSRVRAYEHAEFPEAIVAELHDLIRTSECPFETMACSYQVLTMTQRIIDLACNHPETLDLLSKSVMTERLDATNMRGKRLLTSMCAVKDADFSNQAFARLLEAYELDCPNEIVNLHDVSTKISPDLLHQMVELTPYECTPETEAVRNLSNNQVYRQVLSIASNFKDVRYETLDLLYREYSAQFLDGFVPETEHYGKVTGLMLRFARHPDRQDICSVEDRIRFMESIGFIGQINPFEFGEEGFVDQAWDRLINTLEVTPAQAAETLRYDHAFLKVRMIYEGKGLGEELLRHAKPKHRDGIFAQDLGL